MQLATYSTPLSNKQEGQHDFCDTSDLRTTFSLAMSAMYRNEVPLYGDLVAIVRHINQSIAQSSDLMISERLDLERHGAIRLGAPSELHTVRRLFALIGLSPVGYYDLSAAGLPMHATAFRPLEQEALAKNPFRVFTTLLRPELLSPAARDLALSHILRRNIFSDTLLDLIEAGEQQGGLYPEQGEQFVVEALQTFRWQAVAATTLEEYEQLQAEHSILADIACFNTAHINHLTPRTLDIDAADRAMREAGMAVKSQIEGPPARRNPILLRQTSFLALEESIKFHKVQGSDDLVKGRHRARFGEIEQRGAAVTKKGRALYDRLMQQSSERLRSQAANASCKQADQVIEEEFRQFPDDKMDLIQQGLIYCSFRVAEKANAWKGARSDKSPTLSELLVHGVVVAEPLTYEDFLPLSAAGIFMSNLQQGSKAQKKPFESFEDKEGFESSLGCAVADPEELYAAAQEESLRRCARALGLTTIAVEH